MDNLRSMLKDVTDLELAVEVETNKRISLKCELVEIVNDMKFSISVPIHSGHRYPLDIGKRVLVYFKKEELGVCHFSGLVVSRTLDGIMPLLFIQMVSSIGKIQRRDYFRLPLVTDVIFKIPVGTTIEKQVNNGKLVEVEIETYKELKLITKDISGGGLRTIAGEKFEAGQKMQIIILLERERLELMAEVVRCQLFDAAVNKYECGLRFLKMEEKDRNKIIAFIFDKQRNLRKKGLV